MPDRYDNLATRLSKVYNDTPKTGAELKKWLSKDKGNAGKLYDVMMGDKAKFPGTGSREAFINTYSGGYSVTPQRKQQASAAIGGTGNMTNWANPVDATDMRSEWEKQQKPKVQKPNIATETQKAVRGEGEGAKRLRAATQQLKDRADYQKATGKELRHEIQSDKNGEGFDLNKLGVAPTVARDEKGEMILGENGEPQTGIVNDTTRAGVQMKEENMTKLNDQLEEAYAERDRIKELLKNDEEGNKAVQNLIMSGGYDPSENEVLDEHNAYYNALRQAERRITELEAAKNNGGFWRGTWNTLKDPSTYSFGLTDIEDAKQLKRIKDKVDEAEKRGEKPNLTEAEQTFVDSYLAREEAEQRNADNKWYQRGQGFGESLSFMKDFAVTGGGFASIAQKGLKLGGELGKQAAKAAFKSLGSKSLAKTLAGTGKALGLVAGTEAGGLLLTNTAQAASTAADIINKQAGKLKKDEDGNLSFENGKSLGEAILSSEVSRTGENASELFGVAFDAVPGILGKVIQRTTPGKVLKNIANNKAWKAGEKGLNYLGVQSVWGEGMEEEYGMLRTEILNTLTNGKYEPNGSGILDTERQLETWATVGLTSMLLRVPAMVASGTSTANYYANKYNLNSSDKNMRDTFGNDERYNVVKTAIDEAENNQLAGVLNNLMTKSDLTNEEKQAMFTYANDLVKMRGFNIGNVVAAANGYKEPPRVSNYNINGLHVDEVDKDGNVINSYDYDNADDLRTGLYEMQQNRADQTLQSDLMVMKARPDNQYQAFVDSYCGQFGVEPEELEAMLAKPSMERTEAEQSVVAPFADSLHNVVYDNSVLHEEQSQQDGEDLADVLSLDLSNINEEQALEAQKLTDEYKEAENALQELYKSDENIKDEIESMAGQPAQNIVSSLETFSPKAVDTVIGYFNAKAKLDGFVNRMSQKIDEEAANRRERHTFTGTINGQEDKTNVVNISDGTNTYTLVSGNVTTDQEGRITGSDTGLIIALDENGDFVQLSDTSGYGIVPSDMTLDQYQAQQAEELQLQMTSAIDPEGKLMEEQGGNNADVEAGGENTGADEASATALEEAAQPKENVVEEEQEKVEIPEDKNGAKRYEQANIDFDTAIEDMQSEGLDVNEMADAYINEANERIEKLKPKKGENPGQIRKRAQERLSAENVKAYYENLKKRYNEQVSAEKTLNTPVESNNEPQKTVTLQPKVATQPKEINVERVRKNSNTPEGRKSLLDRKKNDYATRWKIAKLIYGDLFDDDSSVANNVEEVISMNLLNGRSLDPDSFAKELGWDMRVGRDAAKVSTMFDKRRENGGEGTTFNKVVHDIWESPENTVDGEKRFSTEDIRNALIAMFNEARDKWDITEWPLKNRIEQAEKLLREEQERINDEKVLGEEPIVLTDEEIERITKELPFEMSTEEDIPDSPITKLIKAARELMSEEGTPNIEVIDTDRMPNEAWRKMLDDEFEEFLTDEEIDQLREEILEEGVYYNPETGKITVFSGEITPEELRKRVQTIKDYINDRDSNERRDNDEGEVTAGGEEGLHQENEGEAPESRTGEGNAEPERGDESVEETDNTIAEEKKKDEYLEPRNDKEKEIISDVEKKLAEDIKEAEGEVKKARSALEKAQTKESDKATDVFSDDEAFKEKGQLFDFEEMPTDRSVEGVERRTEAERERLLEAEAKLENLKSEAEHDSRVRGALDEERRQTEIPTAEAEDLVTATETKPVEQLSLDDVKEAAGVEDVEPQPVEKKEESNPSGNKLVTDERYEELKKRMRDKLLGQMNVGVDPEILAIGVEMAVYHIEKGARKFGEFAKNMIADLGDVIRPYLKAFYNGARDLPEMEELSKEMDDYGTVQSFDVANFDKRNDDPLEKMKEISDEEKVEKDIKRAKENIKVVAKEKKQRKNDVSSQQQELFNINNEENDIRGTDGVRAEGLPADNNIGEGNNGTNGTEASQEPERTDGIREEEGRGELGGNLPDGLRLDEQLESKPAEKKNQRNNRNERGKDYAPTTPTARVKANIEAIRLLKKLEAEGRDATQDEMDVLKKYSGWGGLGGAFNERNPNYDELRETLDEAEYDSAAMSVNSAYFTPASIIDRLWDIAGKLGFKGGNILESSAGIGNIIGSIPESMNERSDIEMVEIDSISGRILEKLYPDAKVDIKGFEDTRVENGSIDLAITNVPFVTGLKVRDEVDTDLSRQFGNIHDFVIAKNIRKLREGGIGIFITTSNTLDKSDSLREWIDGKGDTDVMGVFRLNNETFGGTNVTSDIIVVRKRVNGERHPDAINVLASSVIRDGEYEDPEGKYDWRTGRYDMKRTSMRINNYLNEHPENMGGEMAFNYEKGDTFRPGSYGLFPSEKNQGQLLDEWVSKMKNVFAAVKKQTTEQAEDTDIKEGRMFVKNGKIYISQRGKATPYAPKKAKVRGKSVEECVKDYDAIRSSLSDVLKYQLENEDDKGLKPLLDKLNKAYDDFVNKYGYLHKNVAISFLKDDIEFPDIAALENYTETEDIDGNKKVNVTKSKVFSGRVIRFKTDPKPKNVKDGVLASVQQFGKIDIPWMASVIPGQTEASIKSEILNEGYGFEDPVTKKVEVRYEYLSGNVREKLRQARDNNVEGRYDKNINELEKVLPMDIPAHLIDFSLGSSWIDPKLYEDFVKNRYGCTVHLVNVGGVWSMEVLRGEWDEKNRAGGVHSDLLNDTIPASRLIEAAINNRTIKVQKTFKEWDGSKRTETDKAATQACQTRIGEIKDEFNDWAKLQMQKDVEMAERMMRVYNDKFNSMVPKEIDDTFIPEYFDGAVDYLHLYPHQAKAVMRAVTEPVMLAHQVGAGKTFTLITTAMEMRRLGTAKKPMIVVQNSTIGQFVAAAKTLYPNAKILSLSEKDRDAEGRRSFYGKIKYNDWDMIVIPQSTFERIPDSPERQQEFIQEKIDDKLYALEAARQADADERLIRQMERELESLEEERDDVALGRVSTKGKKGKKKDEEKVKSNTVARAKEQLDRHADDVMYFDEMGIDALLIDEAHEYKRLGFSTTMTRGVKGIDPAGSKKAAGVYLKTRGILKANGWKNVVFATGTPISNTAAEIWTFMRYLMPKEMLMENEIWYFDDFVHNFGKIAQSLEFATNGKFKENTRFAAYINKPELIRIWSTVADTVLAKDMPSVSEKLPDKENGKDQDVFLPQTQSLIGIMRAVRRKLEEFERMSGAEKRANSSLPLVMYGIAKRAAIDPRLVDSGSIDEPDSKTNKAVEEIMKDLGDTEHYKGTVAVFCDMQNGPDGFNIFSDMKRKLMERGIDENKIAIITSGMTIPQKEKIFEQVNNGDIRVIMGSTQTLGTGVNVQERLHLLIHMDAPDRPMDYTQRNGRIQRQGNLHKDWDLPIRILRFGVEDSLDVTSYQRLKTKSAFIDSIMDGKSALANNQIDRTLEEEEEGLFDNPVAVLSGSQFALKKTQAERELRKWQSKKQQWEADQVYIENTLRRNNGQNKEAEERIKGYDKTIELSKKYFPSGKATTITIKGVKTENEEELQKALTEQVNKPIRERVDKHRNEYGFTKATVTIPMKFDDVEVNVEVKIERESEYVQGKGMKTTMHTTYRYKIPTLGIDEYSPERGFIKDIINDIREDISAESAIDRKEAAINGIAKRTADNEQLEARRSPTFKDEDKLEEARKKVQEYTEKMREEMAEKEAKYAAMDAEEVDIDSLEENEEEDEDSPKTRQRIDTTNPMEAINRAADSWRRSVKESESSLSSTQQLDDSKNKSVPLERRTTKSYTDKDGNYHRGIEEEISDLEADISRTGTADAQTGKEDARSETSTRSNRRLEERLKQLRAEVDRRERKKRDIKNEYNIDDKGNVSIGDLSRLFHDLNSNKAIGKLFEKVYSTLKELGVDFRFSTNLDALTGGESYAFHNVTFYNWDILLRDISDQRKAVIILHEMIHNLTSHILERYDDPSLGELSEKQKDIAKELLSIYNALKEAQPKDKDGKEPYGMNNAHEMIAELANPAFREILSKIPYRNTNESILQKIKNAIRKLLGIGNALGALGDTLDKILDTYDTNGIEEYREQRAELEQELRDSGSNVDFVDFVDAVNHNTGRKIQEDDPLEAIRIAANRFRRERNMEPDENPAAHSARAVYEDRLNRVETVFSEAYQDSMISLKAGQNAIAKDKDIPDSQNAYMAENLMHGKNKNEQDLFNLMFRDPLIKTINKIMDLTGMNWGDVDRYVYTKSGLERNREFYVRDWLEANKGTEGIDEIRDKWLALKGKAADIDESYTFADYLDELTDFIKKNINAKYDPSKHDYSGFRAMFGEDYDESEIIDDLMNTEAEIGDDVNTLWEQINACTKYGLDRYKEAGLKSEEQIENVKKMFHWYVPMRGFKEDTGEDMYQYFTGKGKTKNYVGGLLRHAKGRGSEASYPISTIFAMTYKAISDCNQNLVNQKFYRLCQAHKNDLVVLSDSWVKLNEDTGEWEEVWPEITDDMDEEDIRKATIDFEKEMNRLADDDKAKKIKGKPNFVYKPIDKNKKSEHVVEVWMNGQKRLATVVGNPRMAQALNGQLRFERSHNVFSQLNAYIKNFMSSLATSYNPTFALGNMLRDWTHFRTMLIVREGEGYAHAAGKYYEQQMPEMMSLFKKYREGTLGDTEMERDFKDFMDNGGITGFVQMNKIDEIQKEMEKLHKQMKEGKIIKLNDNIWMAALHAVEAFNEAIENNARFATYRASRHYANRTKARSAYDAKEITVNFNRKGAGSKTAGFKGSNRVEHAAQLAGITSQILGEGRIFFNATVQAIATTFKNFQNPDGSLNKPYIAKWAAKYAAPPFLFGLALPFINQMLAGALGGDDDDDPYANLPEWTRRKKLCLYAGKWDGHDYFITIPVGQELAAFLSLGDMFAGYTYAPNLKPIDRSFTEDMIGIMNTFSPIDVDTKITKGGITRDPMSEITGRTFSVLAPLVAVEQNLSWTGREIYREDLYQNDYLKPEYQMVYSGTNPVLVGASKILHELGGGDDITRGKMEVNPAIVQYLWEQYTGGPGKVFSNTISIGKDVKDIFQGKDSEFNVRKVEGLKAFVQQGDDRTEYYRVKAKYRKYKEDADKLYNDIKGYKSLASEDPTAKMKLDRLMQGEEYARMKIAREAEKHLAKMRKSADALEGAEKKKRMKEYNKLLKEVVDRLDDVQ